MSRLADNLARVQERIAAAAGRVGRDPAGVTLVAVTKTHPAETLTEAIELGLRHFGENRIEEALDKLPSVAAAISDRRLGVAWHMIGHVQSRKAEAVAHLFDWVHSVESARLAERLSRFAGQQGKTLRVLLEFNVSGEARKYGWRASNARIEPGAEWLRAVETIAALPYLRLEGLMTMAPIVAEAGQARPVFRALRELRDQLAARFGSHTWQHLSMGMTDDFEVAIEEGATIVRIGRAIFDTRGSRQ